MRVLPLPAAAEPSGSSTPFGNGEDLLATGWVVPSPASPATTWLGANAEPDAHVLRIGRTTMITPSSVLQIGLGDRAETLLKQEPVLGDFDPDRYETSREWAVAPDGGAGPDLGGPPPRSGAAGTVRALRLRRLRDVDRPVVLTPPPLAPRPRRRLRHRARARRRRDGPGLVRGRAHGAQGQHLLGLRRLRTSPRRARSRSPRSARGARRLGRRLAHRRRGQPGARSVPRARRPGPLRRLRHHHARRRAPAHRRRVGGVGQPAGRRVRLPPHADLLPLRQCQRHQP